MKIWLDLDIRYTYIPLVCLPAKHIYTLSHDVSDIVYLHVGPLFLSEVHTYDYICSHLTGKSCRIVVPHSSVHKHHSFGPDRRKDAGNRHGGTHRKVHLAAMPDLGLS